MLFKFINNSDYLELFKILQSILIQGEFNQKVYTPFAYEFAKTYYNELECKFWGIFFT